VRNSVVLIDDEPWALKDMGITFPWAKYGFKVAGCFQSGKEALSAVLRLNPGIVCTDIRLIDMNGIELLTKARKEGVESIFIVVSAYGEFELARQAMHYGAIEYCLKPLSDEVCENTLLRIRKIMGDSPSGNSISAELSEIIDYIRVNLGRKLKLEEVSGKFHISPNTLYRMFRSGMDMTFTQYVESERLNIACRLLSSTALPISEIAGTSGFSDPFYFSNLFKRRMKQTPTQYRKTAQGIKEYEP
jgi:two-component system response regulator YesN